MNFQRKDAKTQRCGGDRVSLAPGFSQVAGAGENCVADVRKDLCGTTALTPRRGSIVRRSFECRGSAVVRIASGKPETDKRCTLSSGERVRVRGSVQANFMERDGIHVTSYVTKAIPKEQLEGRLHEAVRLARARLAQGGKP